MFNVAEHLLWGAPLHLRATVTLRVSTTVPLFNACSDLVNTFYDRYF